MSCETCCLVNKSYPRYTKYLLVKTSHHQVLVGGLSAMERMLIKKTTKMTNNRVSCNIKLYKTLKNHDKTYICRLCKQLFHGKNRRKKLREHTRRHLLKSFGQDAARPLNPKSLLHNAFQQKDRKCKKQELTLPAPYICDICFNTNEKYQTKSFIEKQLGQLPHMTETVHARNCKICNDLPADDGNDNASPPASYFSVHSLNKHVMEAHMASVKVYFPCNKCPMKFQQEVSLGIHKHFSHCELGICGSKYNGPFL